MNKFEELNGCFIGMIQHTGLEGFCLPGRGRGGRKGKNLCIRPGRRAAVFGGAEDRGVLKKSLEIF
jgi:hypothetical protein